MRTWRHWMTCLLLSGAALAQAAPAPDAPAWSSELDRELQTLVDDPVFGMSGLSVLVLRDGALAYQGQFGHRYIDPRQAGGNRPVTADTMFRIASISKLVTTLGVLRLVEAGKLNLDADVGLVLGQPLRNPAFPERAITLRMLLSHTSSLRDEGGYSWGAATTLAAGMAAKGQSWDTQHAPGSWFAYSNLNWSVIGTVMEAASGKRFDLLMQELVLAPLGMDGGFHVAALDAGARAKLATLYRRRAAEGQPWDPRGPWVAQVDDYRQSAPVAPAGLDTYRIGSNGSLFSPAGGLRTNASSLGKLMCMLLARGQVEGRPFLQPQTIDAMLATAWRFDPQRPNGDTYHGLFTHWGLGVQHFARDDRSRLVSDGSFPAVGHLGSAWGLLSLFALNLEQRSGMVVLIGGTASDPERTPGAYSALSRQEERVITALHQRALRDRTSKN